MAQKYIPFQFKLGNTLINCFALENQLDIHKYNLTQVFLIVDPTAEPKQAAKRSIEIINTTIGRSIFPNGFQSIVTFNYNKSNLRLISEEEVGKFWVVCAGLHKYPKSIELLGACAEEALSRRANKALNIIVTEEEYNERFKARTEGKLKRRDLTDSIKSYIERNNIEANEAKFLYKNTTDKIYECLTGLTTKQLREILGISWKETPRDYASKRDLMHIAEIEAATQRYIDIKNVYPLEAVEQATNSLLLSKIGWKKETRI